MVFSSARVSVPPWVVGPLLHELGLDSHSAKPGENWGVLFVACLEQAEAINATAASAARLVSLFDAGMSPPVGKTAHAVRRNQMAGTHFGLWCLKETPCSAAWHRVGHQT